MCVSELVCGQVSRGGEHKLAAIWKYDKRSVNNTNFVYFGVCLEAADTPVAKVEFFCLDNF